LLAAAKRRYRRRTSGATRIRVGTAHEPQARRSPPPLRTALTLVLTLTLLLAILPAASPAAPRTDVAARLARAADRVVSAGVPGIIVLVRDGDRTVRVARGSAQLRPKHPMRATDRFRVGSITKTFVATVVAQLAAEGKLGLDDPIERWLPGAVPNGQAITLRHLLGHRSGIFDSLEDPQVLTPYLTGDLAHTWTPEQLIAIANAHPPLFAPGTQLAYSNTNYILLGRAVEAVTGRPVGVELADRVFGPLGLRSTFFATEQAIPGSHAHGYFFPETGPPRDTTLVSPTHSGAAGAIVSTTDDLARFYRALLSGKVVRADMLAAMETLTLPPADQGFQGYGLGLFTVRTRCGTRWGHDGGVAGYNSLAFSTRDGQRQFVLLANALRLDDSVGNIRAQQAFGQLANAASCLRPGS
jgi:D-alanyl-D-alanine carboxypeptidase